MPDDENHHHSADGYNRTNIIICIQQSSHNIQNTIQNYSAYKEPETCPFSRKKTKKKKKERERDGLCDGAIKDILSKYYI